MRIARVALLFLTLPLWLACGCVLFEQTEKKEFVRSQFSSAPIPVSDRVVIDYRLVDQPAGDPFAVDRLWTLARSPLAHDHAALLAENGLRVGLISGITPEDFVERVTSERNLIDPRALVTRANEMKVIALNGPLDVARYQPVKKLGVSEEPVETRDVECGLMVQASAGEQDRTRFCIVPAIQSGTKQAWLRPTADKTRFTWDSAKTKVTFDTLMIEVSLGPNEYLVIGPTDQPKGTLGELFFFAVEPARLRQRFLVLRGRSEPFAATVPNSIATKVGQ